MGTDRELLELAARAAGMKLVYAPDDGPCRGCQFIDGKSAAWNPLTDDGDAFRLSVALHLHVRHMAYLSDKGKVEIGVGMHYLEGIPYAEDKFAATRRAIVRAAAEIGKAMP